MQVLRLTRRAVLTSIAAASLFSAACFPADAGGRQRKPANVSADAPARVAPSDDLGRFVVTNVLIDPALDNMQQRYFGDDPRFVGRLVTIEPRRVFIDGGRPCTQVERRRTKRTIADLLRARSQRRGAAAARAPTSADYRLVHTPTRARPMVEYRCTGPDRAAPGGIPGNEWTGVTGWSLGVGRHALLWGGEVLLLLESLTRLPDPQASFPCGKAGTPAERTICSDASLANWDRSVAAAYRLNLVGQSDGEGWVAAEDPAALEDSQRQWLTERDGCGMDRTCLLDEMVGRTDALMRRQYRPVGL